MNVCLPSEATALQAGEAYTLHGRLLGRPPLPYPRLQQRLEAGARVETLTWPPPEGTEVHPFFTIDARRRLRVCTGDGPPPAAGETVLALVL